MRGSTLGTPRMISFALFFLGISPYVSFAGDTISGNESISGDRTLVSAGRIFELGFTSLGNSSRFYVCIWYARVSERTPVWVANRETPVPDRFSSVLKIQSGNLVILDESQRQIWSTNLNSTSSSSSSASLKAVLLDSGNFVFSDESPTAMWQSSDYPTHTWLPGTKLGLNKVNGRNQQLISWKNSEDPTPGIFALELDPRGSSAYFILWNQSVPYWTSGPWNDKVFASVPEMTTRFHYNFTYVSNENESYFIYWTYRTSVTSRLIMDISGQIKQVTWMENAKQWNLFWSQPGQQCGVYSYCGAYGICNQIDTPVCSCFRGFRPQEEAGWNLSDYSGGCVRTSPMNCGSGGGENGDRFLPYSNMTLPDSPHRVGEDNAGNCERICLRNCSCTAYAFNRDGCSIWVKDLINAQQLPPTDSSGNDLYVRVSRSEFSDSGPGSSDRKRNNRIPVAVIGTAVSAAVVVLVIFIGVLAWRRRTAALEAAASKLSLVAFKYRDLKAATKNFTEKIGEGGFGSVFKGTLLDSSAVAVKKLQSVGQGDKQFRAEVRTLGTIQHVNLVRLRGFFSDERRKLLVYDYMHNGSLDLHLFSHGTSSTTLDWKRRYEIALGIARGLEYLHDKCRYRIIHCDVKPENVLLDAEFGPKISDFGLAKLLGRKFSRVLTTMRGTRGYIAPEWISSVTITSKADVYSYGMVLFEIVSGRRNFQKTTDQRIDYFPSLAASVLVSGGDLLGLSDDKLERKVDIDDLERLCRIACWCIQDEEEDRPTMGQIVQILEKVADIALPPVPKSLQVYLNSTNEVIFFEKTSSSGGSSQKTLTNLSSTATPSSPEF